MRQDDDQRVVINDLTTGWQNLYPLSHPNTTLAPQARQVRACGEIRTTWQSGEILNFLLSHYSNILSMIIVGNRQSEIFIGLWVWSSFPPYDDNS